MPFGALETARYFDGLFFPPALNNKTFTANGTDLALAGAGSGSSILGNNIFANTNLGIDLGNDGVTPNDPGDTDTGPNNLQNFPVLSALNTNVGTTNIQGSLNSSPNTPVRLDFFSNKVCDPSGFDECETFLGFGQVTTDITGNADFSVNLNGVTVPLGSFVTVTATDSANNSSEFAACFPVGTAPLADLELIKEADKTSLTVGEQVIFKITLANKGPDQATGIEVIDAFPAGMAFDQVTASECSYDTDSGAWAVASLPNDAQAVLTIKATVVQQGTFTNTAEVTACDQTDQDSAPNNGVENEDDQSSVTVEVQDVTGVEQHLTQLIAQLRIW